MAKWTTSIIKLQEVSHNLKLDHIHTTLFTSLLRGVYLNLKATQNDCLSIRPSVRKRECHLLPLNPFFIFKWMEGCNKSPTITKLDIIELQYMNIGFSGNISFSDTFHAYISISTVQIL